ncbi:MAG TPA: 23S rRNA (pseudouridine(1915)-N(3))-methyltransferase RlmH [Flavisolibacter sp.]|nr:23S rRNA (pseudouridine(1915)-N(3))-methyltransferase RlmH [Flavisolibacter sp.]
MRFAFWSIGKSHDSYIREGVEDFSRRLTKYFATDWIIIPPPKNAGVLSEIELKKKEAAIVLEMLKPDDYLVVLDERGKSMTSVGLAAFLEQRAMESTRQLIFLIGGAYGTDVSVLQKAKFKWSLSELTFPHQLVRLILTEQVYRACTILRNEKYHHK